MKRVCALQCLLIIFTRRVQPNEVEFYKSPRAHVPYLVPPRLESAAQGVARLRRFLHSQRPPRHLRCLRFFALVRRGELVVPELRRLVVRGADLLVNRGHLRHHAFQPTL